MAIGAERALAGSANFTRMGMEFRHELSLLIEDPELLQGLRAWFDALWLASPTPDPAAVRSYAHAVDVPDVQRVLDALADVRGAATLGPAGPRVRPQRSRRIGLPTVAATDVAAIATQLRDLFDDATSANAALDLLNEAIALSGLDADDERLFVNARGTGSQFRFSVTIGNRYVASLGRRQGRVTAALMVSEPSVQRADVRAHAVSLREPFASNESLYLARLPWSYPFTPPADVLDDWRATLRAEAERASRSPYRTRWGLRPGPFYAVADPATRAEVLRLAYQDSTSAAFSPPTAKVPSAATGIPTDDGDPIAALAERLRAHFASADPAAACLDLFAEAIRAADLNEGDPRVAITLPHDGKLVVLNVNRREVLGWRPDGMLFLVYEAALDEELARALAMDGHVFGEARPQPGPRWILTRWQPGTVLPARFRESWLRATRDALDLGQRSPFRRYHRPEVFHAVVDHEARARMLDMAFGSR